MRVRDFNGKENEDVEMETSRMTEDQHEKGARRESMKLLSLLYLASYLDSDTLTLWS